MSVESMYPQSVTHAELALLATDLVTTYNRLNLPDALSTRQPSVLSGLTELDARLSKLLEAVQCSARTHLQNHVSSFPNTPLLSETPLFHAIGSQRDEVIYSRSLAWILDPNERHGLKSAGLYAFLDNLPWNGSRPEWLEEVALARCYIQVCAEASLGSAGRADVLITSRDPATGEEDLLLIEMKLDALEQSGQMSRYEKAVKGRRAVLVFLTPDGRKPVTACDTDRWLTPDFVPVARVALRLANQHPRSPGAAFVRTFARGVLEDACGYVGGADVDTILACNRAPLIEAVTAQ